MEAVARVGVFLAGAALAVGILVSALRTVVVPRAEASRLTSGVFRTVRKGFQVRVIPVYDGINDHSMWRLDVLYGVKTVDARQAVRLSGSP